MNRLRIRRRSGHLPSIGLAVAFLAVLGARAALAQSDCAGGVISDDNSFEAALGAATASVEFVMRVAPPPGLQRLDRVCVCWTRSGADESVTFDLNVYSSTVDGRPGPLIDTLPLQSAQPVSINPNRSFFSYDLSSLSIEIDEPVFIGPKWQPGVDPELFVCMDQNGPGSAPAFFDTTGQSPPANQLGAAQNYRALGIRAEFTALESSACVPDEKTLCIDDLPGDRRFQVDVAFQTTQAGGQSGHGKPTSLASLGVSRGGLLTFFSDDNPEMLIKVLDACAVNGHYWVFYSAGTNVALDTRVIDTATGRMVRYLNPDRTPAPPVQHLQAFPCAGGPGQPIEPSGSPFDFANDLSTDQVAPSICQPSPTTLCIDHQPGDRRFEVEISFETTQAGGRSGPGQAISLDTLGDIRGGLFWFFSQDNPEMLIKVLDACAVNGHHWVFYSAGTNVGLTTTVTDTQTGRVQRYTNTDRMPAPALQHLNAFSCQ